MRDMRKGIDVQPVHGPKGRKESGPYVHHRTTQRVVKAERRRSPTGETRRKTAQETRAASETDGPRSRYWCIGPNSENARPKLRHRSNKTLPTGSSGSPL